MNQLVKDYGIGLLKAAIIWFVGWLAKKGVTLPDISPDTLQAMATTVAGGVVLGASRVNWRKWLLTAQAMDAGVTTNQVAAAVAGGQAPAVSTPANESPTLTSTTSV